jgi:uncharacterized coiled-coil protein SlyX
MSADNNDLFTGDRGINEFGGETSWGDDLPAGADNGDDFVPTSDDVDTDVVETETEADAEAEVEAEAEAEAEAEVEEEDDADTDAEEEVPAKGKKDSNPMVPRQRLNKEIQKRQQLEARIRDLETQSAVPPAAAPAPVKEAVKPNAEAIGTMFSAVLDGDEAKAQTTLEQILTEFGDRVVTQALAQSKDVAEGTYSRNQELNELRTAAAEVTEQYPEFDQNSAEVDMGLTEEVLALRDSLIDRGEKPAAALRRAAKLVALENGITARGKADLAKPPVQSKPKDVAKQIAKATQTPGRLKGEGAKNKEVKLDIMKLSDDQFGKLSRDALAKARGDFF